MRFQKYDTEDVFVIYIDSKGNEHSQSIQDLLETGVLEDPVTGEDMYAPYVDVRLD